MHNKDLTLVVDTLQSIESIVENLLLLVSEKEKKVINKRFNLDNNGRHTLESIGQEFSVTRERVRQIENNALTKMRRNVFNTSLKHLQDFVASYVRNHGGLHRQDTLVKKLISLAPDLNEAHIPSINLSLVLHEDLDNIGNTINFHPYVKFRDLQNQNVQPVFLVSERLLRSVRPYKIYQLLPIRQSL